MSFAAGDFSSVHSNVGSTEMINASFTRPFPLPCNRQLVFLDRDEGSGASTMSRRVNVAWLGVSGHFHSRFWTSER